MVHGEDDKKKQALRHALQHDGWDAQILRTGECILF